MHSVISHAISLVIAPRIRFVPVPFAAKSADCFAVGGDFARTLFQASREWKEPEAQKLFNVVTRRRERVE